MKYLYRIVLHPALYAALSAMLVALAMSLVGWADYRDIESNLDISELTTLESYAATLEGGTTNSRAMGSAMLFGLENQDAKQAALDKLPRNAPRLVAQLAMLREMYTAELAFLVNKQGIIVAYSGKGSTTGVGRDISFRPYVQQALKGAPSVYPAVGIVYPDRGIFLAAPVRAGMGGASEPIGAVVLKIGADKLDLLLKTWTDGIAVLASPQGVVFAASRGDWLLRVTGQMSDTRLAGIVQTRQFGKEFGATPPLTAPFMQGQPETSIDGVRYAVNSQALEWNDPEGDWQLTFLERRVPWWQHRELLGFAALAGLISAWLLYWFYTLTRNSFQLEEMNAQLRHNEELLNESQSIAGLGFYTLHLDSGKVESSEVLDQLFGVDQSYEHSLTGWLDRVHPDDREMMEHYLMQDVLGRNAVFDKEYRIVRHNDRTERWVHGLGKVELDGQGRPAAIRGTIQDITTRKRNEQKIHDAMRELEQKELAKSRFLAAAGHDLRQPLAAANLFIDALKATGPNASQGQILQRLDKAMETFNGLLDTLLNISKLDAGAIRPDYDNINVEEIITWLEQNFAELANEKKLRFKLYFSLRERLAVRSDIGLLKSALMNLVSNAIKFTPKGGILVSARRRGSDVLFQVWDTGIGISPDYIGHIYDEFYQINNPQRDRASGLGLGLAITRRALALLNVEIKCRSQPGRGTMFEFRLPIANRAHPAVRPDTAAEPPAPDFSFAQGKRFIVVEDDAIVAQAMLCVLENIGGKVQCFQNAEDALRDETIEHADYFIADYMLAGKLNGIQFLNQMRQRLGRAINGVLMTGDTSPAFLSESNDSPWTVLHKPVNLASLIAGLRKYDS